MPPALPVRAKVRERDREALAGAGEIGRRTRAAEEDRGVVEETRPLLLGGECDPRHEAREVIGESAGPFRVPRVAQVLLEAEPFAEGSDRVLLELLPEVRQIVRARHLGRSETTACDYRGRGNA